MLFPDFNKLNVETQYTMLNHVTKTYGKTIRYVFEIRYDSVDWVSFTGRLGNSNRS